MAPSASLNALSKASRIGGPVIQRTSSDPATFWVIGALSTVCTATDSVTPGPAATVEDERTARRLEFEELRGKQHLSATGLTRSP